ncbi:late competence development ComFB family protein [Ruminococcus sp. HUN007]|uniref:late competence development ComFB family protein n=1 Tax=Ruminococcus sp. HUN007 TaxID=1514668 RepID=UPI00067937AA|nr:late competence development ComFB family protein [Ruminococcus sp. HUN007]
MTNTRRTKRNINKELMFSKIMPTYSTGTYNEYYQNGTEARGPRGSEPDTFKIREKVLDALKDRVPMQDDDFDMPPVKNSSSDFSGESYRQAYQNYHQNSDRFEQAQQVQSTRVFPVQTQQTPSHMQYTNDSSVKTPSYTQYTQNTQVPSHMQYTQDTAVPREIRTPVQTSPVSADVPRYINMTEEVLLSKLDEMIAKFKCCSCEKCRQHIMLQVLNSVKPEYVYKKPSEVRELIENNNYVDINQPIIKAVLETKSNPPHKK